MSRVWAVFKKEFTSYWNSLIAYFFLFIFLIVVNMFFIWFSFIPSEVAVMRDYFNLIIPAMWLFIPAVTMRSWSDEKRLGTQELLMTMPLRDIEAVGGKFLAAFAFLLITLFLSFVSIPTAVAVAGGPDWGPIFGGYLGLLLLGSCFIAIGLAVSSLTEHQFISFIISSIICLALLLVSELLQRAPLPAEVVEFVSWLDAGDHFEPLGKGLIRLRDMVYFFSIIAFFVVTNYLAVTSRRWK
ncbi:MAG: ABC transporter permease [bacterium]